MFPSKKENPRKIILYWASFFRDRNQTTYKNLQHKRPAKETMRHFDVKQLHQTTSPDNFGRSRRKKASNSIPLRLDNLVQKEALHWPK